ncbi:MAG: hypothetical protein ABWK53_03665 [Anaerolineales bacterium]
MSYLDRHPAGTPPLPRRARVLEFLTGFAGWFALFSVAWSLAAALGQASLAQNSALCLLAPGGLDMLVAVALIASKRWHALSGFVAAFLVNGFGLFIAAVTGFLPGGFNLAALVMHIPFYFPFMTP